MSQSGDQENQITPEELVKILHEVNTDLYSIFDTLPT